MKVYLDWSIINEWLKFESSEMALADYANVPGRSSCLIKDLGAFSGILDKDYLMFLYSPINEIESRKSQVRHLFDDFISRNRLVKVSPVGVRACMVDEGEELPKDNMLEIGPVQDYFFTHDMRRLGPSNINSIEENKTYMRKKFFDPMHIDSAISAKADVFLTVDYRLLRCMDSCSGFQEFLVGKIQVFRPSDFQAVKTD